MAGSATIDYCFRIISWGTVLFWRSESFGDRDRFDDLEAAIVRNQAPIQYRDP